ARSVANRSKVIPWPRRQRWRRPPRQNPESIDARNRPPSHQAIDRSGGEGARFINDVVFGGRTVAQDAQCHTIELAAGQAKIDDVHSDSRFGGSKGPTSFFG